MAISEGMSSVLAIIMLSLRGFVVVLSSLFVLSSLIKLCAPKFRPGFLMPLFTVTYRCGIPVRHVLPKKMTIKRWDYAPLITSCIILVVFLGLSWIIQTFVTGG